jgi:hypothetical protein
MNRTSCSRAIIPSLQGLTLLTTNVPQKLTNLSWIAGSFVHSTSMLQQGEMASLGSVATSAERQPLGEN